MAKLTAEAVESVIPGKERREIPDALLPGLYFIVQPTGARSWAVRYRHAGRPRKLTLGPYPLIDLKTAREAGGKALRAVAEGRDPGHEKKRSLAVDAVEAAAAEFLDQHVARNYRPKPRNEAERLAPPLHPWRLRHRKISDITRADVRGLLNRIVGNGTPIAANRLHSIVRKFFNWCVENELIAASPCAGLKQPASEISRDRVLSDRELRLVWEAAEKIGYPFGSMVQLLTLTGQRRGEVANMQWGELDLQKRVWSLPRERVKNNRTARCATVAAGRGNHRANTADKRPLRLLTQRDGAVQWLWQEQRSLGRTIACGHAELGHPRPAPDRRQWHGATRHWPIGDRKGFEPRIRVVRRHRWRLSATRIRRREKRAALQRWADYVEQLVDKRRTPLSGQA